MYDLDYNSFKPNHLEASKADFAGNGKIGRYVFIPGSHSTAEEIAKRYFKNLRIISSMRGYTLFLGDLEYQNKIIKAASVSTGMGTPSVDIIVTELILLGVKRLLRIGTAGGMQPQTKVGDVVFATAAVRDESTSSNYVPLSFPAVANYDMVSQADLLRHEVGYLVHMGVVHTKDSLYAREFSRGPSSSESVSFMQKLKAYGVLASEMECSHLYVLSSVYTHEFQSDIKSGCVLGIIGNEDIQYADTDGILLGTNNAIDFGVTLIKKMAYKELNEG